MCTYNDQRNVIEKPQFYFRIELNGIELKSDEIILGDNTNFH